MVSYDNVTVQVGSRVRLEDQDGEEEFFVVSSAEADPVQPADTSASAARAAAVLATRIPAMGILLRRRSESIVTLWPGNRDGQ